MIEPSTLLPLIAPIGFFLAIGVLLDRIIGPKPLPSPDESVGNVASPIRGHVQMAYRFLFEEFFSGRMLSVSYLSRVAGFSVTLFVCTLVIWDWPSFSEEYDLSNHLQVLTLVFCALFNVIIDAVSARITKAFMWFAINTRSLFNTIVALFSDVIFTVSTFKYMATILFTVFYSLSVRTFFDAEQSKDHSYSYIYQKSSQDDKTAEVKIAFRVDGSEISPTGAPYSFALLRIDRDQVLPFYLLNNVLGDMRLTAIRIIDLESGEEVSTSNFVTLSDDGYTVHMMSLLSELAALPDGVFSIQLDTDGLPIPYFLGLDQAGNLFEQLNVIEANLLGDGLSSGGSSAMALRYNELFAYNFGFTPFADEEICFSDEGFVSVEGVPSEYRCDDVALVIYGVSRTEFFDLWGWNDSLTQVKFPVAAMLLTSIWFSLFLYVYFVGYTIQALGMKFVSRWTPYFKFFFSKAPFSLAALLLGTLFSILINFG